MRLNLAAHLLDARLSEGMDGRPAIRSDHGTWSYGDVARLSSRYAHLLTADDVRPEERVIVALPDGADFVGALFGVLRRGSVVVMVNPDAPVELLQYFFAYTRATAAFVSASHAATFAAVAQSTGARVYTVDPAFAARLASLSGDYPAFASHRDDPAMWLFSGGTTGRPKGVVQSHRSFANTTALYGQGVLGLGPDDITISVPKLFFGYATGSNLFFPFSVGASCVLFPARSQPGALVDQIRRHRPTILINVPTMIQQMLADDGITREDLASLRLATSAGEALPADLHARWMEAFGVELLDGLGTAEMWHIFLSNRPGDVVPGTLGRVVPGFDIKLCDAQGDEVPDGEVGALWVKGDSRALGYWQQMDDTKQAFRGEWYVSSDMLRRNPDGTFVYGGRADDMLKVGGKWVAPGEVENCLLTHTAVREVAVVGVSDRDGLVKPCAFVVTDTPSAELGHELQAYVKTALEPYKYPRAVVFVDALPRTHLGKVDRGALARSNQI